MRSKKLLWLLPLLFTIACGNSSRNENKSITKMIDASPAAAPAQAKADRAEESEQTDGASVAANSVTTGLASTNVSSSAFSNSTPLNSPQRKITRTADFKCKVNDVFETSNKLEAMVKALGGVVQESNLQNNYPETRSMNYKPDSLRLIRVFTSSANLVLRVPFQHLDSVIHALPGMVLFIDSRVLSQNDVTYGYLAHKLKKENADRSVANLHRINASKSKDALNIQQYADTRDDEKVDHEIENLKLMDNVMYATVTVYLVQPEKVFTQVVVNPDIFLQVSFGEQLKNGLRNGWDAITAFVVVLFNVWPLLIFTAVCVILYKLIKRMNGRKQMGSDVITPHQ